MRIGNLHRIFGIAPAATAHPDRVFDRDPWRFRIEPMMNEHDRCLVVALKRIVFIIRLAVWRSEIYWVWFV